MKAMLLAAFCTLLLIGCNETPPDMAPIVRGEALYPGAGRFTLTQQQFDGCVEWLKTHHKEWGTLRDRPPTPTHSVAFTHADGARTQVEFYDGRPGWDETLLMRVFDKNGKLMFTAVENFDESDIASLKAFVPRP